jgi:hypothetical protein
LGKEALARACCVNRAGVNLVQEGFTVRILVQVGHYQLTAVEGCKGDVPSGEFYELGEDVVNAAVVSDSER